MSQGSDFSLELSRALGMAVVHVRGTLDAGAAPALRTRLANVIDGQGNRQVVLDLRGMTAIDRAGMLVLVDALTRMEDYGGDLVLSGPTSAVAEQLRAARLHEVFLITPEWRHPAWGRVGGKRTAQHETASLN